MKRAVLDLNLNFDKEALEATMSKKGSVEG